MDHEETALLRDSLEQVLTATSPDSWPDALDEFGWHDLLDEDPQTAITLVADLQGRLLPRFSILNDSLSAALDLGTSTFSNSSGPVRLLLPRVGSMDPPATLDEHSDDGATIAVAGTVSTDARPTGTLLVPATDGNALVIVAVEDQDRIGSLSETPTAIEPHSGWVHISGFAVGAVVATGVEADRLWTHAVRTARLLVAQELTALSREMLALAVEHVASRKQFGRALGSFQSVKHGLADTRVWQETAELAVVAGWEQSDPEAAAMAKLLAGRFFRSAAENCQQYLGGMGFTWEHPFHTFLRRGLILEQLLGTTATLRTELGGALRAGTMPVIGAL